MPSGVFRKGYVTQCRGNDLYDVCYEDGDTETVPGNYITLNGRSLHFPPPQIISVGTKVKVHDVNNGNVSIGYVTIQYQDGTYDVTLDNSQRTTMKYILHDQICIAEVTLTSSGSLSEDVILDNNEEGITGICFSKNGDAVICLNKSGTMYWRNIKSKSRDRLCDNAVAPLCNFSEGNRCISGTRSHGLMEIDVRSNKCKVRDIYKFEQSARSMCFLRDDVQILVGSNDGSIYILDHDKGKIVSTMCGHIDAVLAICVSVDNKYCLSGSADNSIRIWSLTSKEEEGMLSRHLRPVQSLCLSPDDKLLFSGSSDKTIRIWNWREELEIRVLQGHSLSVNAVVVSPDGSKLVSASSDFTLRVWDLTTLDDPNEINCEVYCTHTNAILAIAMSTDGRRIATGGSDGTIRIWRAKLGSNSLAHLPANAVNDSSRIGVDRLGFTAYAQAMYNVLSEAEPPVCVGLYARWGSGKSFMIQLLKYYFDKTVSVRKETKELVQWYEEGWIPAMQNSKTNEETTFEASENCFVKCETRFKLCSFLLRRMLSFIKLRWLIELFKHAIESLFPNENYFLSLMWELLVDISKEWNGQYFHAIRFQTRNFLYSCYRGNDYTRFTETEFENIASLRSTSKVFPTILANDEETLKTFSEREYVFVDFNAWEYSRSDELWAGLIRNIYQKIELRLRQHDGVNFRARYINGNEGIVKEDCKVTDWKQIWRIKKAKDLLVQHYGGIRAVRLRLFAFFLLGMGIITTVILSALGIIDIWTRLISGVSQALSVVAGIVGILVAAIPSLKLLYQTNHSVNTSRGDAIFKEANRVQDSIGFLSRVRGELDELFQFMREYETETNIRLILVIFVDDLDRCLEGRNVKVLEAIQLILAIPGAPLIAFLAIDSRVVVASIEATINKSLSIRDALISGYEYMDKIVQVPFCLPEASQEKVKRYIDSCIVKAADPVSVKKMMDIYLRSTMIVVHEVKQYESLEKLSIVYTHNYNEYEVSFDALEKVVKEYQGRDSLEDCTQMLLKLALLFPTTQRFVKEYQFAIGGTQDLVHLVNKDEIVEMMCISLIHIVDTLRFKETFISIECEIKLPHRSSLLACVSIPARLLFNCGGICVVSGSKLLVLDESAAFAARSIVQLTGNEERIIFLSCLKWLVITLTNKGTMIWYDTRSACVEKKISHNPSALKISDICAMEVTMDFAFLGYTNGNIDLLYYGKDIKPSSLLGHTGRITTLVHASYITELLLSGSEDGTVRMWFDRRSSESIIFKGHSGPIRHVCFSRRNGDFVISASDDKTIRIWECSSQSVYKVLYGHTDSVCSVCVTVDDAHIISGSADKTVRIWSVETGEQKVCLKQHADWVTAVNLLPYTQFDKLVSYSRDGTIYVWSLSTLSKVKSKSFDDIATTTSRQQQQRLDSSDPSNSLKSKKPSTTSINDASIATATPAAVTVPLEEKAEIMKNPNPNFRAPINVEKSFETKRHIEDDNALPVTINRPTLKSLNDTFVKRFHSEVHKFITRASLPTEMHQTLISLCSTSESNPRRLKRVLNVALIAYQVAKCKPECEESDHVIADNLLWSEFSARLTKWIFLCELYPYRMSFLVQSLLDLEQKKLFNKQLLIKPVPKDNEIHTVDNGNGSSGKFQMPLLYYRDLNASTQDEGRGETEEKTLSLLDADNMNIGEFFFLYVEQYLYSISSSEKLMRLDGDPELFATLLYATIKLDQNRILNIRCLDVLGPIKIHEGKTDNNHELSSLRDKNFSLMTYAFNLNPSMSKQIGIELQEITTQYELVKPTCDANDPEKQIEVILKQTRPLSFKGGISKGNSNAIEKRSILLATTTIQPPPNSSIISPSQSARGLQPTSPDMQHVPAVENTSGDVKSKPTSAITHQNSNGEAPGILLEVNSAGSSAVHDLDDCDEHTPLLS